MLDTYSQLQSSIKSIASESQYTWLSTQLNKIQVCSDHKALFIALGHTPRHFNNDGKLSVGDDISLDLSEAVRIYLLLSQKINDHEFPAFLDKLCATADKDELIAFYKGLSLYPNPATLRMRAAEGIRSNIKPVFESIAHNNPYPSQYLEQAAWNQMVLKALFIESNLYPIVGLDQRANLELAIMLCDYAHERWSAGRTVSPELWRCVGPFIDQYGAKEIEQVLDSGTKNEKYAALLALKNNRAPAAQALIKNFLSGSDSSFSEFIQTQTENSKTSWETLIY